MSKMFNKHIQYECATFRAWKYCIMRHLHLTDSILMHSELCLGDKEIIKAVEKKKKKNLKVNVVPWADSNWEERGARH